MNGSERRDRDAPTRKLRQCAAVARDHSVGRAAVPRETDRLARCILALLGATSVVGCPRLVKDETAPSASRLAQVRPPGGPLVRWRYHPRQAQRLLFHVDNSDGSVLGGGLRGERWLGSLAGSTASQAAAELAPEALVGAFRVGTTHWAFAGTTGTTYWSNTPLGPFDRRHAPERAMIRTAVNHNRLVAIGPVQRLWASDDAGRKWQRVGPPSTRFVDLWSDGHLTLALASPEALWSRSEPGETFSPVGWKPIGASGFRTSESPTPIANTVLGHRALTSTDGQTWTASERPLPKDEAPWRLPAPPELGPSAQALTRGSATMSKGVYHEVLPGPSPNLLRGRWHKKLESTSLRLASDCARARVANVGSHLHLACARDGKSRTGPIDFYTSSDQGKSFQEVGTVPGDFSQLVIAATGEGLLLVSGVCPPTTVRTSCQPRGAWSKLPQANPAAPWRQLAIPGLEGPLLALHSEPDGRGICAIGRRKKNESLYAFFAPSSDTLFTPSRLPLQYEGATEVEALQATRKGGCAAVVRQGNSKPQIVHFSQAAASASLHNPPVEHASVGIAGNRALAHAGEQLWQSDDYGSHWHRVATPRSAHCFTPFSTCRIPIHCHQQGCVLGDRASRIGWANPKEQSDESASKSPVPQPAPLGRDSTTYGLQCLPTSSFQRLADVRSLPSAAEAMLGQADVFALSCDGETPLCGVWQFGPSNPAMPTFSALLPPAAKSLSQATAARLQVEGAAAMRLATTSNKPTLEIGWLDFLHGTAGFRSIQLPQPATDSDYQANSTSEHRGMPALLSIAEGGAFVRPYPKGRSAQPTWFIPYTGSAQTFDSPRWPEPLSQHSFEMVRVEGQHIPLLLHQATQTVLRETRLKGAVTHDAQFLGNPAFHAETRSHWSLSYDTNHRIGIAQTRIFSNGETSSHWYPIEWTGNVLGAPKAQPTQPPRHTIPAPCTVAQRENTPRVLAPPSAHSTRRVVWPDPIQGTLPWKTHQAVLFGTAERPCLAAYDAEPTTTTSSGRERAILRPEGTGWHFRTANGKRTSSHRLEYRTIHCQWADTQNATHSAMPAPTHGPVPHSPQPGEDHHR